MEDLSKLLQLAEKQRDERSRLNGRIDGIRKTIKDKGYRNEAHARKELKAMREKSKTLNELFEKKLKIFRKRYAKEISQVS